MTDNQFTVEDDRYRDAPPARGGNWVKGCLLGCLAAVVVSLVLGTLATIWVVRNFRGLAASTMSLGIKQGIDATDLPAEEKAQMKVEVDRGVELFREGRMSDEQAAMLVQKAVNSPLMTAMVTTAVEKKYLDPSGLSEEEKAEARMTLPRFIRGMIDEKIDRKSQDAAFQHVGDKQPNDQWKFREDLSDADLRAFLAEAKKAADDAEIPEQPQAVDPSDEVKRLIDEVMAGPAAESVPPLDIPPLPETPPEPEAKD
jgi:hypothetical protein